MRRTPKRHREERELIAELIDYYEARGWDWLAALCYTCHKLWRDDRGAIVTLELVAVAAVVLTGVSVGLTAVRDAVTAELADMAREVEQIRAGGASGLADRNVDPPRASASPARCLVICGGPRDG